MNAESEAAEPGFTIYDLHTADSPRRPQELPRLVAAALRIVWAAGPREAATATVLQIVGGLGTHDELMAAGARYAELFTLQAGSYR